MGFQVVTDSTCDLPMELIKQLGVTVVPCNVHFGEDNLRDGVDIDSETFYRRLVTDKIHPLTSQPSVGAFAEAYQKSDSDVLSIHVSSKLSGTLNSANQAKTELTDSVFVDTFDSLNASLGLGLLVVEAARMSQEGKSIDETKEFLEKERRNMQCFVSVDTLEYLVKGGRASRIQGFLGGMLDIKPLLQVREGEIHPVGRVRKRKNLFVKYRDIVSQQANIRALGILHGDCSSDAEELANSISDYFPRDRMLISCFTPVLGVHLGPGALGIVLWVG